MKKSNLFVQKMLQISLKNKENCYPFHVRKCTLYVFKQKRLWLLYSAFCSLSGFCRGLESDDQILWRCFKITDLKMVGHRLLRTQNPSILKPSLILPLIPRMRTVYTTPRIIQKQRVSVFNFLKKCLLFVFHATMNLVARVRRNLGYIICSCEDSRNLAEARGTCGERWQWGCFLLTQFPSWLGMALDHQQRVRAWGKA